MTDMSDMINNSDDFVRILSGSDLSHEGKNWLVALIPRKEYHGMERMVLRKLTSSGEDVRDCRYILSRYFHNVLGHSVRGADAFINTVSHVWCNSIIAGVRPWEEGYGLWDPRLVSRYIWSYTKVWNYRCDMLVDPRFIERVLMCKSKKSRTIIYAKWGLYECRRY